MENALVYIILNTLAVFNILVICSFLILRKNNSLPNYILAIIFLIPGMYFVDNILISTGEIYGFPYFFFFVQIIANLFPIAVYKYVHLLIGPAKKTRPILIISSTITIVFSLGLLIYFIGLLPVEKVQYIQQLSTDDYPESMNSYNIVFYVCQMIYLTVLYYDMRAYKGVVERNLSAIESVKLLFVWQFIMLLLILNFLLVLFYVFLPTSIVDYGVLPVVVTLIYLFVIVFSIKNNVIFSHQSYYTLLLENQKIFASDSSNPEAEGKPIEDNWKRTIEVLEHLMNEQKVYKQTTLSLSSLSELVDEQPYIVSQILNQHFKKTFFDFINEARVEEAKIALKSFDSKIGKIENIALEVGFNSRASFYRSFKKITGKNPTDFVS